VKVEAEGEEGSKEATEAKEGEAVVVE